MHQFTTEVEELAKEVLEYSLIRLRKDPPLDGPKTAQELYELAGNTITEKGLGGHETLKLFKDVLAKACISTDHPRYLAFIPSAPSEYANLFDLVVGASALYGGSWLEGAGAVFAENQALKWISDLASMPSTAGGVFAQGGTVGNLSALVTARNTFRSKRKDVTRWVIAASSDSHASIRSAAEVMDVGILLIKPDKDGSLQGDACAVAIDKYHTENPGHQVFALVATAGTTNLGIIDNLQSIAACAKDRSIWFHVDGAYGLAALCAPSVRGLFNGIEKADSFIVDPHKWLFAPFDACALIYKNPKLAKKAHLQKAAYLETLDEDDEWNPSDYAIHLTRRARGLPFWFSLAAHGTAEYAKAMERTMAVAKNAADQVRNHPNLKLLMEPTLSIVAFERVGWNIDDYEKWSDKLLADQIGFVTPSSHKGKPILRFAIVNPWTSEEDIEEILATL
jgi:glutamate/tyrosine decarboxylase-like PLP-dependent enzyme